MTDTSPENQGSLERLGINLETNPGEGVLTAGTARGARFRMSKPQGYAVRDVEDFVFNIVIPSLEWYQKALHERDEDVHRLGRELDLAEVDNLNLQSQLAVAQYGASLDAGVQANQEDREMAELLERYHAVSTELQAANTELETLRAAASGNVSLEEEPTVAAVDSEEMETLRTENANLTARVEELDEAVRKLEEYSQQQDVYIDQLESAYNKLANGETADAPADNLPEDPAEAAAELIVPVDTETHAESAPEPAEESIPVEEASSGTDEPVGTKEPERDAEGRYKSPYGGWLPLGVHPDDLS